jgi:hypothetical protein
MSVRICRLFFWIAGAPEDRPGGPWWYRDFMSDEQRDAFLEDVRPFLCRFVLADVKDNPYKTDEVAKGILYIQPPPMCNFCEIDGPVNATKHPKGCPHCGWSGV